MKQRMKMYSLITIIAFGFLTSCIKNEVTKITLNKATINLTIGQIDSLAATVTSTGDISKLPQTWTTSNTAVATIKEGIVTAVSSGIVTITVQAGEKTATCEVTVDNKIFPVFTKGILVYWGDYYNTKLSNNFVVSLRNTTDTLLLDFNTDSTVIDNLPAGTYEIQTDLKFLPNTLNPVFSDGNYYYGSWYFGVNNNNPISTGNAIVSVINKIYTIEYKLIDYYGNSISGTYQGTLTFYDGTIQNVPAAIKSNSKNKQINTFDKLLKLKTRYF